MPTRILALGEVLWDVFPDGPRFGGAPANFACSAASLGGWDVRVAIASAVGDDALGRAARQFLEARGVDASCVTTSDRPTGTVTVTLDAAGSASYRFAENPAWGDLRWTDALAEQVAAADVIYFGTLAQSREPARTTIRRAVEAAKPGCLRVLDLNLREPFWDAGLIHDSVELSSNVLKLNDEEWQHLAAAYGIDPRLPIYEPFHDGIFLSGPLAGPLALNDLFQLTHLTEVALTQGATGSFLGGRCGGDRSTLSGDLVDVVDTVGAGDAFTAALALGMTRVVNLVYPDHMALDKVHCFAAAAASFACTVAGGTPVFPPHLTLAEFVRHNCRQT